MPQYTLLPDVIAYLTNQTQLSPRNLFLKIRFRYPQQLPLFVDFLAFVLVTTNIKSQQAIQVVRVVQLLKELVLEADLFATLLLLSKICPIMKNKHITSSKKNALQSKFKQWLGSSSKQNTISSPIIVQNGKEILAWIEKHRYLKFYIHHMNHNMLKYYEDIGFFFTQLGKSIDKTFNEVQIAFLKAQMLTQYQKMNTAKYKQETITCLYQWFREELKLALTDPFDNSCSLLSIDTLSRIVRFDCDLASSTLIQACKYIVPYIRASSFQSLIRLIDEILLASNAITIIQTVLVVIPTIFLKAISPKTKLNRDLLALHLNFWRQIVSKRFIESTLLMCLNDWFEKILGIAHSTLKIEQLLQLFKVQLLDKVKNKNLQDLKCIFAEKQMQKIQQVYQQLELFHQILQKSNVSYFQAQKKNSSKQHVFNYEVSLLSSKAELMSMLDSIHNRLTEPKLNNVQHNQQLNIYSNKNSEARSKSQEDKTTQSINYVISMLELLGIKPQKKKENTSAVSLQKQPIMPFLPLYSTNQKLENNNSIKISDPYGLNIKLRQQTLSKNPIFIPINQINKKKVIKNKGIIINNSNIEIGYIFESILSRRRIKFFITFAQPTPNAFISIEQNSIRCTKPLSIEFQYPKVENQFKTYLDIQKVSLYKLEGHKQIQRLVKPKILIRIQQKMGKQCKMKQQIPLYLYNLIQWLEIPQDQQEIFNLKAQITSGWYKVSNMVRRFKQAEINNLFPDCKLDKNRTILVKMRFLLEVIFCKIYIVLDQIKIELINSDSEAVLIALLEIACQQDRNNQ